MKKTWLVLAGCLLAQGCATTYSGVCRYKKDPPYRFSRAKVREVSLGLRAKEYWVEVQEGFYRAFDANSCTMERD